MQKLKPELFDNKFFTVKGTNHDKVDVLFVDFLYSTVTSSTKLNVYPNTMNGPQIYSKTVQLHRFDIPIDRFMQMDETKEAYLCE